MIECCALAPRCEYHHCRDLAKFSVWQPAWGSQDGKPGNFKFMCVRCCDIYKNAMTTPMKGIDPPENAPDDWKGSIWEHYRHAKIALDFLDRQVSTSTLSRPKRDSAAKLD